MTALQLAKSTVQSKYNCRLEIVTDINDDLHDRGEKALQRGYNSIIVMVQIPPLYSYGQ